MDVKIVLIKLRTPELQLYKMILNNMKKIKLMTKNTQMFFSRKNKPIPPNTKLHNQRQLQYLQKKKIYQFQMHKKIKTTYKNYLTAILYQHNYQNINRKQNIKYFKFLIFIFLIYLSNQKKQKFTTENDFLQKIDLKTIQKVQIFKVYTKYMVSVQFKDKHYQNFFVLNPNAFIQKFQYKQIKQNVNQICPLYFHQQLIPQVPYMNIIKKTGQLAFIGLIFYLIFKNKNSFNINSLLGKNSVKKINSQKDIKIKFSDVAGMDQAKKQITQFVQFLKMNAKFKQMGATLPKGALLTGPPGTGKTMLAKACAGEAGVPFFYMSGSQFIQVFVGVGASRVRQLFKQAKEQAPSIIFIDQIDTIGKKREGSANDEKDSTLNQLLVQMDGFNTNQNVIVLAASNRKQVLDNALTRPGRFDRLIQVQLPDIAGRMEIFKVHLKPLKLNPDRQLNEYARRLSTLTPGFSGADIANLCNEAAILAARKNKSFIQQIDFQMAAQRVMAGLEKKNMMTLQQKKIVSYHEAGHAVTAWFLEGGDPLVKVTIIPRSKGSLGYAQYLPNESSLKNKQQLMDRIAIILGGRLSEQYFFGKITTGARDDLQKVYSLCRSMITRFGMNEKLGNVAFETEGAIYEYSKKTGKQIDEEILNLVRESQVKCRKLIKQKAQYIQKLAQKLMQKETLNVKEIIEVLGDRPFEQNENYKNYIAVSSQE